MDCNSFVQSYPSTSTSVGLDEGVISVDISRDVLEDSFTDMSNTSIPPDLVISAETNEDPEDSSKLTLAYERLFEIPRTIVERFSDHIKYLDISHNKITNLDALVYFKHLTSLIVDHNPITENCTLPPLPKLELLWMNHCKIGSLFPWVGKLKESCPHLQYLCLMGNPAAPSYFNGGTFYEYLQYRLRAYPMLFFRMSSRSEIAAVKLTHYSLFVISQFSSLNHLDDCKVTEDQRAEAQRLYKRPLVERLVKPGSGGFSQLMHSSVTWSGMQNKLTALWRKEKRDERNLMI